VLLLLLLILPWLLLLLVLVLLLLILPWRLLLLPRHHVSHGQDLPSNAHTRAQSSEH
jgi:hypothetical protein